ncbi:MAG: nucleotidyltransferase family protein [Cyclobacteriaceae bacterium]|jgi:predicted nucleotidyltransferase|nr:nucleotidyltransferase family protein [Flammeovirgaceae bacterium]
MITHQQQAIILDLLKPLKPVKVGVFGSYARGENKEEIDLDILVHLSYPNTISLLKLAGVEQNLQDALGIPIDLVTDKSISPYMLPYIQKDLRYILE